MTLAAKLTTHRYTKLATETRARPWKIKNRDATESWNSYVAELGMPPETCRCCGDPSDRCDHP